MRHRASRTKNGVSGTTFVSLVFKLAEEAAKPCRRIRAREKVGELSVGVRYAAGIPVPDNPREEQQEAA